jgi:hypothetical protein
MLMNKRHGLTYTVKYLKACQLAVQKKIAGQPLKSLRDVEPDLPLPRLTKSGLPKIILTRDRSAIVGGSYNVIRMYLSIFAIYRVIKSPMKAKLNTITDGYSGSLNYLSELERLVPKGMLVFTPFLHKMKSPESAVNTMGIMPILKASSDSKISFAKLLILPKKLVESGLWDLLLEFTTLQGNYILKGQMLKLKALSDSALKLFGWTVALQDLNPLHLGKLSFKEEAAGKLRVFAMVDVITQSALFGLHEWIYELLRSLPNDGTFDQDSAFRRAQDKAKKSGCSYGYDLSSATDRLPISLQAAIIGHWFGDRTAQLWRQILVSRPYHVVDSDQVKKYGITPGDYHYAVGQPMGAYSSFAMLAVTHHFIVQWAYHLCYPRARKWFLGYELLGDDIVIFDRVVASKYLEIMASLGLEINLSKSIVSDPGTVVEFAKRTSYKGVDVSAVSLKMILAAKDLKSKVQVAFFLALKTKLGMSTYFKALHAFGLSQLYKDLVPLKALYNANERVVSQLVENDGRNLFNFLACYLDPKDPESFLDGGKLQLNPSQASRIVSDMVKGNDVHLAPNNDQYDFFYILARDLKMIIAQKIVKQAKRALIDLENGIPVAMSILLRVWFPDLDGPEKRAINLNTLTVPGTENSTEPEDFINPKTKAFLESVDLETRSYLDNPGIVDLSGTKECGEMGEYPGSSDLDLELSKISVFKEELELFLQFVWFGPAMFDSYSKISKIIGLDTKLEDVSYNELNLYPCAGQTEEYSHYEKITEKVEDLFNNLLVNEAELRKLKLETLYEILFGLQSLSSYPKRFDFALDKMKGGSPDPVEPDKDQFAISIIKTLTARLEKTAIANDTGSGITFLTELEYDQILEEYSIWEDS